MVRNVPRPYTCTSKRNIKTTAITDGHTGTIPPVIASNIWGWGKINAWVDIPSLVPPQPAISPSIANICTGSNVTLTAPSGYSEYNWSTGATTPSITVSTAGNYKVKVTNSSGYHSSWSNDVIATVNPTPPVPTITKDIDTLISSATTGNQWYKNGTIISGAIGQKYTLTSSGDYKVVVSNIHDCTSESAVMNTYPTSFSTIACPAGISIYPNPVVDFLEIYGLGEELIEARMLDITGKVLFTKKINNRDNKISVTDLNAGIYMLEINDNDYRIVFKFQKQ